MGYQKIINLLDNTANKPSKIKTKNWIEINDESRGTYNIDNQIRLDKTKLDKIWMTRSSLCDCSDAYVLVKETITVVKTEAQG